LKSFKGQLEKLHKKVDLVAGGPPCQGFSTAGKRDEEDRRNKLINDYISFIDIIRPKVIFFENVRGFTLGFNKNKSKGKRYSLYVIERLRRLGYNVCGDMVDFSKFGVPQKRCRFILIGVRNDIVSKREVSAENFFERIESDKERFLISKELNINTTLEDAISDLLRANGEIESPDSRGFQAGVYRLPRSNFQKLMRVRVSPKKCPDSHRFVKHRNDIVDRFKMILNTCERNRSINEAIRGGLGLKKHTIVPLAGGLPTPTLTTLPDDYIHYNEPRILTVREYARIQTFPDDFEFKGKYTTGSKLRKVEVPRYTQIGNAIPPLFGELSGVVIQQILRNV
ncbi:MAG: DNA cytosine methyltransferase, partial [Sphingobacteriales bacterium]